MVYYNINKLELLVCVTENCEQNFLGVGGGSASFPFVSSFTVGSQTEIPKGFKRNWVDSDSGILRASR